MSLLKKLQAIKNAPKAIAYLEQYNDFMGEVSTSSSALISMCAKQDWKSEVWRQQLKENAVKLKTAAESVMNLEQPDLGEVKTEDVLRADSLQEMAMRHYQDAALKFIQLADTPKLDESSVELYKVCVQDFTAGQDNMKLFHAQTQAMREKAGLNK